MNHLEYEKTLESNEKYRKANEQLKIQFAIANAVYKARTQKGFSQSELAKMIGTKQANISRIEAGLGNPTINLIQKLAKVLDFHVELNVDLVPATLVQFIEASNSIKQLDYPKYIPTKTQQINEEICFPKFSMKSTSDITLEVASCN